MLSEKELKELRRLMDLARENGQLIFWNAHGPMHIHSTVIAQPSATTQPYHILDIVFK